jgi:hypothetical protein
LDAVSRTLADGHAGRGEDGRARSAAAYALVNPLRITIAIDVYPSFSLSSPFCFVHTFDIVRPLGLLLVLYPCHFAFSAFS